MRCLGDAATLGGDDARGELVEDRDALHAVEGVRPIGAEMGFIRGHADLGFAGARRGRGKLKKFVAFSPRRTAATSRQTLVQTRFCPSWVNAAMWGVRMTLSIFSRAPRMGGSVARTSSAAPA